jgi:hypothetical protein
MNLVFLLAVSHRMSTVSYSALTNVLIVNGTIIPMANVQRITKDRRYGGVFLTDIYFNVGGTSHSPAVYLPFSSEVYPLIVQALSDGATYYSSPVVVPAGESAGAKTAS